MPVISIDPAKMKGVAAGLQGVQAAAKKSDYPDVHDCGSSLVADTVDFFLDKFTRALKKAEKKSESLATAVLDTADDFESIEESNVQTIQALADALKELVPDE